MNRKSRQRQIEQLQQVLSFSENDCEALLVHATEVQTTDPIPLSELAENVEVDSTPKALNNLQSNNSSSILNRNAPPDVY